MKHVSTIFALLALLATGQVKAQLAVGSSGMTITAGTPIAIDGLALTPSTALTLTNNLVQRSNTPLSICSGNSLTRVYTFLTPISFTGTAGVYYLPAELNGNTETALQLAFQPAANAPYTVTTNSVVNTAAHFVSSSLTNQTLATLTATTAYDPVRITQQPPSGSAVCAGSSVSVPVSITGSTATYQWYQDGQPLSGQTGATLTLTSVQTGQSGAYALAVSGSCNSVTSTAFSLTVNAPFSATLATSETITCVKTSVRLITTGGPTGASYSYSIGAQASNANSATASVSQASPYSVTVTAPGGCSATATTTVTSNTVTPTVSITPTAVTICQGQTASLLAQGADAYQWSRSGNSLGQTTASLSVSLAGPYSVTGTSASNGCSATATAQLTVTPLPNAVFTGLPTSVCLDAGLFPLSPTTPGGSFSGPGISGTQFSAASAGAGGPYSINYSVSSQGCSNTSSQLITVNALPLAPLISTQTGQAYPGGQSSLTVSQNTGPVVLTVSSCPVGTLSWSGGSATTLPVSTTSLGTQSFTATCTNPVTGCTSPVAIARITVVTTTLGVLYRDADYGSTGNNIIKPYVELSNAGSQAVPYSEITVRYWFTSEGNAPPTNLSVYYAPLGAVSMTYVVLGQPRQGATGYVEYSFPGGGSLAGGANSGPIENGIQKTDGSNFDETDDYSYQANYSDYLPNARITAYRKGILFYGVEPTAVTSQTGVQVYSQAKDGTTTSQIQTRLELRNTGNVALPVAGLKLRYYFTSDNGQLANVYVDYADIGAGNVAAKVVKLASPVSNADSYVELSFPGNSLLLNASSSLGAIDFRLVRSDYGLFDQTSDYSFVATYGSVGLNNRITAYLNNNLVFGTPPSDAPARIMAAEVESALQVRLLGNPIVGPTAEVEITGVQGQVVHLQLVDLQGRSVHEQQIEQAAKTEHISVPLGSSRGQLLLNVSTASQRQHLKLLRP